MKRALCAVVLALGACAPAPMQVQAPGKIAQALDVVSDLSADASLVPKGRSALKSVKLERGDDGVTFSGFIAADPGTYTLEIVFAGVPSGAARHFLGRLVSDSFTVSKGDTSTPAFNKPVDVIGGASDHGDDDSDGLGFLDELLLGTNSDSADSDLDGVNDGEDCSPSLAADAFPIADGGSIEDCDADGHRGVNAPFGDPGTDCNDEDADVHPGAEDACGSVEDTDCNPSTCPVNDNDGPTVTLLGIEDGQVMGCHSPVVVRAADPSTVSRVQVDLPDSPFVTGQARFATGTPDADDPDVFVVPSLANQSTMTNVDSQRMIITAIDGVGNSTVVQIHVSFDLAFPSMTLTGPDLIEDAPVDITITPTGPHPLVALELRATTIGEIYVNLDDVQVIATLDPAGGTVTVDPADIAADGFVVYPFARDNIGNEAALWEYSFFTNQELTSSWLCDQTQHSIPARRDGNVADYPSLTALEMLPDALSYAATNWPTFDLVKVIAFAMGPDGHVNLAAPGYFFISYAFLDGAGGAKSIDYFSKDYNNGPNPVVNENDGSISDTPALQNVNTLVDSDVVVADDPCTTAFTGNGSDYVMYLQSGADTWAYASTNSGETWAEDAHSRTEIFACN